MKRRLVDIRLHGDLYRRFGRVPPLAVASPGEAIRALSANLPGFREHLLRHSRPGYQVLVGRVPMPADMLDAPSGRQVIRIVPVAAGSSDNPTLNIIAGVALIALTWGTGTWAAGPLAVAPAQGGIALAASTALSGLGYALAVGGVSSLMFPIDAPEVPSDPENQPSYKFDGPVNTISQGACIPVGYGELEIGGAVISFGIDTEDVVYPESGSGDPGAGEDVGPVDMPKPPTRGDTEASGASFGLGTDPGDVIGSGGGGGTSHTPVFAPDSLQSRAVARMIILLHQGPGEGWVDPEHPWRCVTLDGTPVESSTGEWNFPTDGVFGQCSLGYPDQLPLDDFPDVEQDVAIGVEVKDKANEGDASGSGALVRTIDDPSVDSVRVRLEVGPFYQQAGNGDLNPTEVDLEIWARPSGGTWILQHTVKITGKTMSTYQRSVLVRRRDVGGSPWDIKVVRVTADNADPWLRNQTAWNGMTLIQESQLTYANRVVVGLRMNSQYFNKFPTIGFRRRMQLVEVPSNYDPVTRTYTGLWDGNFKLAFTKNPAWQWRDLIVNDRYGCGRFVQAAQVDHWGLYEIAKYCDELVPDGQGGVEPRFECNLYLQEPRAAWQVLVDLAAVFRAMVYTAGGLVYAAQDAPRDPVAEFNQTNVVGGRFTYASTSDRTRYNRITVYWNDPAQGYHRVPHFVQDLDDIRARGMREKTIDAMGCTRLGQADRAGRAVLYDSLCATDTCTWTAGLADAALTPGMVVRIQDPERASLRMGGRLRCATLDSLTLDAPFVLEQAISYEVSVQMPDGSWAHRPVTNPAGSTATLDLGTPLPELPVETAVWNIRDTQAEPSLWVNLGRAEDDPAHFTFTGVKYNPEKYAWIESGAPLEALNPTETRAPLAPAELYLSEGVYLTGADFASVLRASWPPPYQAIGYLVSWRQAGGNWVDLPFTPVPHVEVRGLGVGGYEVRVRAVSARGLESPPILRSLTLLGKALPPSTPTGLRVTQAEATLDLQWDEIPDVDRDQYELRYGLTWAEGSPIARVKATRFQWPLPPPADYLIRLRAIDTSGNYSTEDATVEVAVGPSMLAALADDHVLSVAEKPAAIQAFAGLSAQVTLLRAQAKSWNLELPTTNGLQAYLEGLGPYAWDDTSAGHDTTIPDPAIWTSQWTGIYTEISALTVAIQAYLGDKTDSLEDQIAGLGGGGFLKIASKPMVIEAAGHLQDQLAALRDEVTVLGGTLPTASDLPAYLETLGPPAWDDLSADTPILDATEWSAHWNAAWAELANLQGQVATLLNQVTGGALGELLAYLSDNWLSIGEKARLQGDYATAKATWAALATGAQAAGLPYDELADAWLALTACVESLAPPLDDLSAATRIAGTELYTLWSAFDVAVLQLQIKLQAASSSVTAVATEHLDLSGADVPVADGYALANGDTVMLAAELAPVLNGIYQVDLNTASEPATVPNGLATTNLVSGGTYIDDNSSRDLDDGTAATLQAGSNGTSSVIYSGFGGHGTSGIIRIRINPILGTAQADDYTDYINQLSWSGGR